MSRSKPVFRPLLVSVLGALLLCSGCELFGWLQPHQWWKLNRQPPLGRGEDAYFSVPTARDSEPTIAGDSAAAPHHAPVPEWVASEDGAQTGIK